MFNISFHIFHNASVIDFNGYWIWRKLDYMICIIKNKFIWREFFLRLRTFGKSDYRYFGFSTLWLCRRCACNFVFLFSLLLLFVPTDVNAGLVEHLCLDSCVVVIIVNWFFQNSFQDHLKLICHHLKCTNRTFIFWNHMKAIPCSTSVLKKIIARRCCLIHGW